MVSAPLLLTLLAAQPATTSTATQGGLLRPEAPPPGPDDDLLRPPKRQRRRPDPLAPGAWLPKVGDGLEVVIHTRFGLGDDATEAIRADPPYGAVVDFFGAVEQGPWFARLGWGLMISGPEANNPESSPRQTFQPWEIAFDAGSRYRLGRRWRVRPRAGVRFQPVGIGPSTGTDFGVQIEADLEFLVYKRRRNLITADLRVFGRRGVADHDLGSERRLRRSSCFLWGRGFVDCALAFTLAPGTIGSEARVQAELDPFGLSLWGGWFGAAKAQNANAPGPDVIPVPQDNGDWAWVGATASYAPASDVTVSATVLTGGRLRDSLDRQRVPLFTSDLARTTFVFGMTVRL